MNMKRSKLRSGENMYVVTVRSFVTLRVFTTALTDHFYTDNENESIDNLTRKRAIEILRTQLFFHGIQGEHADGQFEASFEESERYNEINSTMKEFVKHHFPYLINEQNAETNIS